MWDDFITRNLARTNRNLLLANSVLVCILLCVVALNFDYAKDFARGTRHIDADTLIATRDLGLLPTRFVKVNGEDSLSTGVQDVEQTKDKYSGRVESENVKSEYVAVKLKNRLLLVRADPGQILKNYSGQLQPIPDDVRSQVVNPIEREANIQGAFLPFLLNAHDFRSDGYWGLGIGIPVLAFALWNLWKWRLRRDNSELHPIMRRLARMGNPPTLCQEIDQDVTAGVTRIGAMMTTNFWIIDASTFDLNVSRFTDTVWAYKKTTKHYTNFIPTGKTFNAIIWNKFGYSIDVQLKENQVHELLSLISSKAPRAVVGFDKKLEELWKRRPVDFVAVVAERRTKFEKSAHASAASAE